MENDDERKKRIKGYTAAVTLFMEYPELLEDEVLKEYVARIRNAIEIRAAEKQQQLSLS